MHQLNGHPLSAEPQQLRAYEQDLGPRYDGNFGLGFMLGVGSMSSDTATKTVPVGYLQDDTTSQFQTSSGLRSTNLSYGSGGSSGRHLLNRKATSRCRKPCIPLVDHISRPGSRPVSRDTTLPLTIQRPNDQPQGQPDTQALLDFSVPGDLRLVQ